MSGSIKLFQSFQNTHQIISIYPAEWNRKYLSANSMRALVVVCCAQQTFSLAAFLAIEAKSMFEFALSFSMFLCALNAIPVYLIFIWQSQNTLEFIESGEKFIAKRPDSAVAYNETIGKIDLFYKFLGSGLITVAMICVFTPAPYSFTSYYIFDKGPDSFLLFAPAWYPFDWKTPSGYLVAWSTQCLGAIFVTTIAVQFLSLLLGSCWLFVFIAEDITQDVAGFNFTVTTTTGDKRTELTKRFCDLVQIYSDAKKCVMELNQTIEYSLIGFFTWCLLFMAAMLVAIQFELVEYILPVAVKWADGINLVLVAALLILLVSSIVYLFILCEPGAMVTVQFDGFSDELSRCDWYNLPPKMQRMYALFLSNTQKPVKLSSYAGITCERDTSKKILTTAYQCFSMFRNFEQ